MDLIPSLPADKEGDSVLAVAVDCFSKWVEVFKCPSKQPEYFAHWFELEIIGRYGIPKVVRTDNGREFEGEFAKLMQTYGILRRKTSPSHPQANGQVERMVQVIKNTLKKYVDGSHESYWSEFLPEVLFYLRFTKARATGMSPFEAIHGFMPDLPSPISVEPPGYAFEDFEKVVEKRPEDIISFFSEFHEKVK